MSSRVVANAGSASLRTRLVVGVLLALAITVLGGAQGAAAQVEPEVPTEVDGVPITAPPADPSDEELAGYRSRITCPPTVVGFELTTPTEVYNFGADRLILNCDYVRPGVEPTGAERTDLASLRISWSKINGRNAQDCFTYGEDDREVNEKHFVRSYDGVRSIEVEYDHPIRDAGAAEAFAAAAAELRQAASPFALVCPNFNEVAFDPIPPYWQPVFGSNPAPPAMLLPDEVTAADVMADLVAIDAAGAALGETAPTSPAIPTSPFVEEALPTDDAPVGAAEVPPPAPDQPTTVVRTSDRSGVWRIFGIGALVLSIVGLGLAVMLVRRQTRIRPAWDYARLAITAVTVVVMTVRVGVTTPILTIAGGVAVGLVLGVLQGRNLDVRRTAEGLFAKRNAVAIAVFGIGLVVTQAASLANRANIVSIGLGLSFLSAAMTLGIIAGRRPRVAAAGTGGIGTAVVLVLLLGVAVGGGFGLAENDDAEAQEAPDSRAVMVEMVDWEQIRVVGGLWANRGKPVATLPVPPGLDTPPAPFTRSIAWQNETSSTVIAYELTETFTFTLTDDGGCCVVSIVADGSERRDGGTPVVHHAEADFELGGPGAGGTPGVAPFGDPELFSTNEPESPRCGRPVAQPRSFGAVDWVVHTVDDASRDDSLEFFLVTDCDVPEFTVSGALALALPPPSQNAAERMQSRTGGEDIGPCPVLQELAAPVAAATGFDTGSSYTVGRLYTAPNAPFCEGDIGLGDFRPGEERMILTWHVATRDVEREIVRRSEINDDFRRATRQFGIYDEDACPLDANGDLISVPEEQECYRRFDFSVGSEVTVWVHYSDDGPDVEVRGNFAWGSYFWSCHHCEPTDGLIRDAVGAVHAAGERARPIALAPPAVPPPAAAESEGSQPSPEDVGAETTETVEGTDGTRPSSEEAMPAEEDANDIDAPTAAAVAGVALIGAVAMAGAAIAESGGQVAESVTGGRTRFPRGPGDRAEPRVEDPFGGPQTTEVGWDTATGTSDGAENRAPMVDPGDIPLAESERTFVDQPTATEHPRGAGDRAEPRVEDTFGGPQTEYEPATGEPSVAGPTGAEDGRGPDTESVAPTPAEPVQPTPVEPVEIEIDDTAPSIGDSELERAAREAERAAAALRPGGIELPPDEAVEGSVRTRVPQDRELAESERIRDAVQGLDDHTQAGVRAEIAGELEAEARADALERARAQIGEIDPWEDSVVNSGVERTLDELPDDVAAEVQEELVRAVQAERIEQAVAAARDEIERQRAVDLINEALDRPIRDAKVIDRVIELLPEDARDEVWSRATAGRGPIDMDAIRAAQPPNVGGPVPEDLLPEGHLDDVMREVDESLDGPNGIDRSLDDLTSESRTHVAAEVERQVQTQVATEVERSVRDRVRGIVGEFDPSVDDMGELLRDNHEIDDALRRLPEDVGRRVEADLVAGMERERVDQYSAALRAALERQQAVALVRERIAAGDYRGAKAVTDLLPETVRDSVLDEVGAGEATAAAFDAQQPGTGAPPPDSLLPELPEGEHIHAVVVQSPSVEEVLEPLPGDVRAQVEDRVMEELLDERMERAFSGIDRSTEDITRAINEDPRLDEALDHLPPPMQREVVQTWTERIERERIEAAIPAARGAARLDQVEAEVRRALEQRQYERVQAIMRGLPAEDAQAIQNALGGG